MTMIMVNIFEAKARLSEYLEHAAKGERVLICKRNRPVAELRAVAAPRTSPRPVGLGKGRVSVPATFFDPLPADVLEGFEGSPAASHSRVAEPKPAGYGSSGPRKPRRSR